MNDSSPGLLSWTGLSSHLMSASKRKTALRSGEEDENKHELSKDLPQFAIVLMSSGTKKEWTDVAQ